MYDIISIGSATFDVFLKSSRFPLDKTYIGGKVEVEEADVSSGGGGTNTAAGFSRLGLKTACVARFGDDLFGKFVLRDLEKENFNKGYLLQRKGEKTDYSTILVNPDGARTILVYRGKTRIERKNFPWPILRQTRYLYLASLEGNVDLMEEVVERAYKRGVNIVLNPGSREIKEKEKLTKIFPKFSVLILNREEADYLGLEREVVNLGSRIVVITAGRQGAKLFSKEKKLFAEAFLGPVIDETGAGDAFSAGFVAGLIKEFSLENALKLGMANGVSVVGKLGAKTGLLYEKDINDWLGRKLRIG